VSERGARAKQKVRSFEYLNSESGFYCAPLLAIQKRIQLRRKKKEERILDRKGNATRDRGKEALGWGSMTCDL
jgi:hypothetical protein